MKAVAEKRSRFEFSLASEEDDAAIRALLRRTPMEGSIRVAFEREPSFFAATQIQGQVQVGVAKDRGRIIGMGTRCIAEAFLNGRPTSLGYLSDLRLDPEFRKGTLLARGYRVLRDWHADGRTQLYYSLVFSDNHHALNTLAAGRAGLPKYHDCGLVHCPGVNLTRRKRPLPGDVIRGTSELLPEIVSCLNRNNARKQFAPVHRTADFSSRGRWRGFRSTDFYVALRDGRVTGVLGKWDLRACKQARVIGYSPFLRGLQPLSQMFARTLGLPRLPAPGEALRFFYGSFFAVDDDDLNIARSLMRSMYNDTVGTDFSYFLMAFHENDPLRVILEDYSLTRFNARLFCVCYKDGLAALQALDDRRPYIELATL